MLYDAHLFFVQIMLIKAYINQNATIKQNRNKNGDQRLAVTVTNKTKTRLD